MAAALETLATVARGRRAFAVLGPMNELGDDSRRRHEEAGGLAARAGVAGLIVGGENAAPMLTGAQAERAWRGGRHSGPGAGRAGTAVGDPPRPRDAGGGTPSAAAAP